MLSGCLGLDNGIKVMGFNQCKILTHPVLGKENVEGAFLLNAELEVEALDDARLTGAWHGRGL